MSTQVATRKTYELWAIIALLPALYIQILWMQVYFDSSSLSASARQSLFLQNFPDVLASGRLLAFISIISAVVAIALAQRSFNQPKIFWRVSSFVIVFIAALIVLLSLMQML